MSTHEAPQAAPRFQRPDRRQFTWRPASLESLIPEDHRVRAVWEFVESLDLSEVYAKIRAVEGRPGRTPIDPRILVALWLYAIVEGVGSARALERLCEEHVAFQWVCGGVSVNHHTLSDFRVDHPEVVDRLLSQSVALLMDAGLVTLKRVAQDGVRVRASAGAASFRRHTSLDKCLEEAEAQVKALRKELEEDPGGTNRRQAAARERAAKERKERVAAALAQWPDVASKRPVGEREEKARVSTTDPEARVMKMGDGGFRPAYNAQLATDTETQVVVGVDLGNAGSDMGQVVPMVEQIERRCGKAPEEVLVDGGFANRKDIEQLAAKEPPVTVYAPVQKPKDEARDPHQPRPDDSEAVAAWRARMGTAEAKEIYKERAATAECVNAIARNRGLRQFLVRGAGKATAIVLWFALAHNMMRGVELLGSWARGG
ncbi:MAG TPA: IS1182 family transposase [Planctomycetota bacterium]|nr:IS1182 family transposase [Planctomycetota bacterium]